MIWSHWEEDGHCYGVTGERDREREREREREISDIILYNTIF